MNYNHSICRLSGNPYRHDTVQSQRSCANSWIPEALLHGRGKGGRLAGGTYPSEPVAGQGAGQDARQANQMNDGQRVALIAAHGRDDSISVLATVYCVPKSTVAQSNAASTCRQCVSVCTTISSRVPSPCSPVSTPSRPTAICLPWSKIVRTC